MICKWTILELKNFRSLQHLHPFHIKHCHFFGSRTSLLIVWDEKKTTLYCLISSMLELQVLYLPSVEWSCSKTQVVSEEVFIYYWLWSRPSMYPYTRMLTSSIHNSFCSKLGGKWYSADVMRVISDTFRWNWVLKKS